MKWLAIVLSLLGPIQDLDRSVAHSVQQARRPALERPMRALSDYARPIVVVGSVVAIAVFSGNAGAGMVRVALVSMAGTNLVVEVIKRLVFRARPDGEHRRSNASFPSGHSATAFCLATVFAWRWRRLGIGFYLLAALVAFSRMYLNRHYLSDVTVGAALGVLCAWAALRWIPPRMQREPPEPSPALAQ